MKTSQDNILGFDVAREEAIKESLRNQESKMLSRVSRVLINLWDFAALICKLEPHESLVVDSQGRIYKGRVNLDKVKMLPEKFPGKQNNAVDSNGVYEGINTRSFVQSPTFSFKNSWDRYTGTRLVKAQEFTSGDAILFMEFLLESSKEDITETPWQNLHGHNYIEVKIKDLEVTGFFSVKTGALHFIKCGGEEIWVK